MPARRLCFAIYKEEIKTTNGGETTALHWLAVASATVITYALANENGAIWDEPLKALVFFAAADYIVGLGAALRNGELFDWYIGFWGLVNKLGMFVAVAVANVLDKLGISGGDPVLRTVACWGFALNEVGSILRNLRDMGVKIPKKLLQAVGKLEERVQTDADENSD